MHLSFRISLLLTAERLSTPQLVTQRPGPTPFATSIGLPEPLLDPGNSRFQQLVLADGRLWGAVQTGLADGTSNHSAIAWFSLIPTGPTTTNLRPTATIEQQSYIRIKGNDLAYPTVAVSDRGRPVLVANLAGPDYYPSTVYTRLPAHPGTEDETTVHLSGTGTAPLDDYSSQVLGGVNRWGDYTNAVSDGRSIWLAGEYVPPRPRLSDANWGTFIT